MDCFHHSETQRLLRLVLKRVKTMADALAELKSAVEENTTRDQSILTLVDQMALKLDQISQQGETVPAAEVRTLAAQLRAANQVILEKVNANTPAETTPTEPTPVEGTPASDAPQVSSDDQPA